MARYDRREPSKRVLVTRTVEEYSEALRRASGLARMDLRTAVVWQRKLGRFTSYHVAVEGVAVEGYEPLVKVSPV